MLQTPDRVRIGANAAAILMAVIAAYCFYRFNWVRMNGAVAVHIAPWTTANAILRVAAPATWAFAIVSTWIAGERPGVEPGLRWFRRLGTIVLAPMVFCLAFWIFAKALAQVPV